MKTIDTWIQTLELQPHTEGGYYKETSRSNETFENGRAYYTNILFLLTPDSPSHFHRLDADETWYYHDGAPLSVHCIYPDGTYDEIRLGKDIENGETLQFVVPKGTIFGSSVDHDYALVSCMVSPGFDYTAFELFTQDMLLEDYPHHESVIKRLAYKTLP
ncbi:cupin [Erysipelothrix larvae]|uniref:Cupin n=1 Tax=Erysipelothrix larvae TaxID=1514105 RepID=A0A109UHE5_9FIRM|nr:cupin domain-containing protein [Erysipelothrix larvae]AMC93993.1 cupin [Erysipelothrix larvae]